MKTVKFIPKSCSDQSIDGVIVPTKFRGHIVLCVPNYFQRQEMRAIAVSGLTSGGETSVEGMKEAAKQAGVSDILKKTAELVQASANFYSAVDLENIQSGVKYSSFEDLSYDKDCEAILQEVAQEVMSGFSISKNS